jgi:hypothetical protein
MLLTSKKFERPALIVNSKPAHGLSSYQFMIDDLPVTIDHSLDAVKQAIGFKTGPNSNAQSTGSQAGFLTLDFGHRTLNLGLKALRPSVRLRPFYNLNLSR